MSRAIEILLAEDRELDAILTREVLTEAGIDFNLEVVGDGVKAMEYLRDAIAAKRKMPEIVILDLNMPNADGHSVLQKMREFPQLKETPVIVLTVSQAETDLSRALGAGMNFYLRKPPQSETLGALIAKIESLWMSEANYQ